MNQLREYWSTGTFLGHKYFSSVMGRERYLGTLECLWIHPYKRYSDNSNKDPLWHSIFLLDHFNHSSVDIDTPCGVSSFDEITIICKSRCLSKSYIKNKPNPYGIRLYSCVGWKNTYLHTIMENGKGHKSKFNPSEIFSKQFPSHYNGMMTSINESHDVVDVFPSKTSCQWVIQMGLQTSIVPDISGKRLFVMDSFYGRHKVGSLLEFVTQGEAKILSTIKLSNVNN